MPLYEITEDRLIPFRRLAGGAELYETEIENLSGRTQKSLRGSRSCSSLASRNSGPAVAPT